MPLMLLAPPPRRLLGGLAALAALALPVHSATLRLRDGREVTARTLTLDEGKGFVLDDGSTLARDLVESVVLQAPSVAAVPAGSAAASQVDGEVEREPALASWEAQAAELEARWPGYPALILRDEAHHQLRADGSRVRRTRFLVKITKDAAIGWGAWQVGFDPARERARLVRARTILPDGRVVPVDPKKVVTRDAPSSSSNLTNRRFVAWRLDEVRTGAWVEHVFEVDEHDPFRRDFFFPTFGFQSRMPVGEASVEVVVPATAELRWVTRNVDPGDLRSEAEVVPGGRRHAFAMGPVPPLVPEPAMPGTGDVTPSIRFSLFEDWDAFFAWEREGLEKNIQADDAVRAKTREVIGDAEDPREQVARIYRYLQDEIRYVSVKSGIGSGWSGHPAGETLRNGYGDCVDKSVLFCSMLGTLGIEATPLTIMTNSAHDMETRLPGFDANHCITRITLGDEQLILDSTTSNYRFPYFRSDDHGQPAADPLKGRHLVVPVPPPEDNKTDRALRLVLAADGTLTCTEYWRGTGSMEAQERGFWKRTKPRDYPKVFRDYYGGEAPGAEVLSFQVGEAADLTAPLTYQAKFRAKGYASRAGRLMVAKLPFFEVRYGQAALPTRRYPIDYRTSREARILWDIVLPEGWRVKAAPRVARFADDHIEVTLTREDTDEGLRITRVERILDPFVPAADYPSHRKLLEEIQALGQEQLFLEEAP